MSNSAAAIPGCGDLITMYLKVDDDDRITEASFEGEGCTISQAGGSIITEMLPGHDARRGQGARHRAR